MKKIMNFDDYYHLKNLENEKWKVKYEKLYLKTKKVLKNISNYIFI